MIKRIILTRHRFVVEAIKKHFVDEDVREASID
jgi:hypothetical protein